MLRNTVSPRRLLAALNRSVDNVRRAHPLVVSFEITAACNCDCRHCDRGYSKDSRNVAITPADICRWTTNLRPVTVQISGGEPLLHPDVAACVAATRRGKSLPYVILVTNGWSLNETLYERLGDAGMDQLSVSLDFPDEEHDCFRGRPGLFRRLAEVLPRLAARGGAQIILNTCITRRNVERLTEICDLAASWGVQVSFSAYTPLRTGDDSLTPKGKVDLKRLRLQLDALLSSPRRRVVVTPRSILEGIYGYFARGRREGCPAGRRFAVVTPEGRLRVCSLLPFDYYDAEGLGGAAAVSASCGKCYVAIRAYAERGLPRTICETAATFLPRVHISIRRPGPAAVPPYSKPFLNDSVG